MITTLFLLQQPVDPWVWVGPYQIDRTVLVEIIRWIGTILTIAATLLAVYIGHILTMKREQAKRQLEKDEQDAAELRQGLSPGSGWGGGLGGSPSGSGGATGASAEQILKEIETSITLNKVLRADTVDIKRILGELEVTLTSAVAAVASLETAILSLRSELLREPQEGRSASTLGGEVQVSPGVTRREVKQSNVAELTGYFSAQLGYDVVLTNVGDHKIEVIRQLRRHTELSLSDASKLVRTAPSAVVAASSRDRAVEIASALVDAGASAKIQARRIDSQEATVLAESLLTEVPGEDDDARIERWTRALEAMTEDVKLRAAS